MPGERRERVEAPGDAAGDEADEAHREDDARPCSVNAASTLPAKTSPRSRERVRIVFSVPLWLSDGDDVAGDERGDQRQPPDRHEEEDDERRREAGVADVAAERHVVRAARSGAASTTTKMTGTSDRRAEAEVRPLLREQLHDLPAVDARDGVITATASGAVVIARLAAGHARGRAPRGSPSPGTSAVIADAGLAERDRQRRDRVLVGLEASSPPSSATSSMPGWARQQRARARSGSVARSR